MQKLLSLLLAYAIVFSLHAQSIGEWQVYPAYTIATANLTVGSRVYALMDGNLLQYDTDDQSVFTYNRLEHLNDVRITHINYSQNAKMLILAYENCNIDLMDLEDNVYNLADLKNSIMPNKTINAVVVEGNTAYICTGFGFLTIDMQERVIRNTYNLGQSITGIKITDSNIYASTAKSVLSCPVNGNWQMAGNWTESKDYTVAQVKYTAPEYNEAGGLYWHSDGLDGLRGYKKESDGTYTLATGSIQPNSPVRDLFYRMQYVGDRLLVSGGINTPYPIYNPATAMYYEGGKWTNFEEVTYKEKYPKLNHWNTTHLVQDPLDDTHHYASPYRTGLYEFRDAKFVGLYNSENSPIQQISNYGLNYNSAVALQFDGEGNLWMANQQTDTIIRILTPEGKWHKLYYKDIAETPNVYDYLFTSSGVNFLVSYRMTNRGFFGFTTNGTLENTADDKHKLRTEIINEDGTKYTPDGFYCMTEDFDGQVWCGTNLGLFVVEDPTTYFDDNFTFLQIKIPRNDGSGLADYLLSGVGITSIAVDGANRKWIGTAGSGIYLVSPDGLETIHHFQTDNSPLLSDNIQCIAVHPTTGLVMIGTDKGLCSYMSDAAEAQEELNSDNITAYPNPVRPDYNGVVTIDGLTMDAEVKICSSTGQLINSGRSNGGRFTWNCRTKGGRRVSSGVYNVIANTSDGKKAIVARIVVIK